MLKASCCHQYLCKCFFTFRVSFLSCVPEQSFPNCNCNSEWQEERRWAQYIWFALEAGLKPAPSSLYLQERSRTCWFPVGLPGWTSSPTCMVKACWSCHQVGDLQKRRQYSCHAARLKRNINFLKNVEWNRSLCCKFCCHSVCIPARLQPCPRQQRASDCETPASCFAPAGRPNISLTVSVSSQGHCSPSPAEEGDRGPEDPPPWPVGWCVSCWVALPLARPASWVRLACSTARGCSAESSYSSCTPHHSHEVNCIDYAYWKTWEFLIREVAW